jgi:hypothetical protein
MWEKGRWVRPKIANPSWRSTLDLKNSNWQQEGMQAIMSQTVKGQSAEEKAVQKARIV